MAEAIRVLIAEDSNDTRELLRLVLGRQGFEVRIATSGPETLDIAREFEPHLVLMDISMPGAFDGVEATRRIKADPRLASTVVIGQTGQVDIAEVRENLKAGFDEYLGKPYLPRDVVDLIGRYFPEAI
ncbi:MAG: response regulator [Cyanobacteria bacterium REEB65]|nr:response regulator [Cyanobacteria bacterium REEB65]